MSVVALPAATLRPARPTFAGAVRSELLKIRRQRLTWVLLAGFVVVTAVVLIAILAGRTSRTTLAEHPQTFAFTYLSAMQQLFDTGSGIVLLLLGARLVSMEYGSGTIRIVLSRGTSRLGLLAAQYTALAILGVLLLLVFTVVAAAALAGVVLAWQGSLDSLTSLPRVVWTDAALNGLVAAVSMAVCILLGTAAAVVSRSVAFAVGVAMGFFPADNFGTIVLALIGQLTHQDAWPKVTQYLLGPVLNHLPGTLQPDHQVPAAFAPVLAMGVDATRCWIVIGAWSLLFLVSAVVLTWRRDVLH